MSYKHPLILKYSMAVYRLSGFFAGRAFHSGFDLLEKLRHSIQRNVNRLLIVLFGELRDTEVAIDDTHQSFRAGVQTELLVHDSRTPLIVEIDVHPTFVVCKPDWEVVGHPTFMMVNDLEEARTSMRERYPQFRIIEAIYYRGKQPSGGPR